MVVPGWRWQVVLLAREGYRWPAPDAKWWLVESPWHYEGDILWSNGADEPFVPRIVAPIDQDERPPAADGSGIITPPPEFIFERGVQLGQKTSGQAPGSSA